MSALVLEPEPLPAAPPPPPESGQALVQVREQEPALALTTAALPERRPPTSIADVQALVCRHFNVTRTDLLGMDKSRRIVTHARHVAVYLSKTLLRVSFSEIGRELGGRDHTTIMAAFRKVEKEVQQDGAAKGDVDAILAEVESAKAAVAEGADASMVAFLEGENRRLLRRVAVAELKRSEAFAQIGRLEKALAGAEGNAAARIAEAEARIAAVESEAERAAAAAGARIAALEAERAGIEDAAARAIAAAEARAATFAAAAQRAIAAAEAAAGDALAGAALTAAVDALARAERALVDAEARIAAVRAEADQRIAEAGRTQAAAEARVAALAAELEALRAAPPAPTPAARAQRERPHRVAPPVLQLQFPPPVGAAPAKVEPAPPVSPVAAPELPRPRPAAVPPPCPEEARAPSADPPARPAQPPRAAAPAARAERPTKALAVPASHPVTPAPAPAPRPAPAPCRPAAPSTLGAFAAKPIAEVQGPRDYFRCERWACTIAAKDCADRHEMATAPEGTRTNSATLAIREKKARFRRCAPCEIGDGMVKLVQLAGKAKAQT